jgi:hypothetical protein
VYEKWSILLWKFLLNKGFREVVHRALNLLLHVLSFRSGYGENCLFSNPSL